MEEKKKPVLTNTLINTLAFSNALNTMAQNIPQLFLAMFMTDYLGINPVAMASGMFIARIFDFLVGLVAGIIIEKTNFKHGKYLSWIRLLTVTLFFGNIIQMLDTTAFVKNATLRLVIVMAGYMTYHPSMNFYSAARGSMIPKLAGADMEMRKRITSRQSQFGAAVAIIGSAVTLPLVTLIGRLTGKESMGYFLAALLFSGAFAVMNLTFCRMAAPFDPPSAPGQARKSPTVGQMIKSVVTNKQMVVLFLCFTTFTIGNQLYTGVTTYFFRVTGNYDRYAFWLTARSVCAFLAALVAPAIGRKLGKKNALITGWATVALASFAMKFLAFTNGQANILVMGVCMCLKNAAMYLYMSFNANYYLDCGEYGYFTTGVDNRTMAVTVMNWPSKIGFAFGGSLVGLAIAWAGYQTPAGGGVGSFASMDRFMTVIGVIPGLLALAGAVGIAVLFKLTDQQAAMYAQANLEREQAAAAAEANESED